MNIRFSPDSLRIRITKEEATGLLASGQLQEMIYLPQDQKMLIRLVCNQQQSMSCTYKPDLLDVTVDKNTLERVTRKAPTRETIDGFYRSFGKHIPVNVEIDVKMKRS